MNLNWPFNNASAIGPTQGQANQLGSLVGNAQIQNQFYTQQMQNTTAAINYKQREVTHQLIGAATQGWMQREASYMFTDAELAEKIWDMAEKLADEGIKRGMY